MASAEPRGHGEGESSAGSFEGSYPPSLPSPAGSAAFAVSPTPSADPHPGAAAARPAGGEPPLYWKARAVRLIPHDAADAINVDGEVGVPRHSTPNFSLSLSLSLSL